MDFAGVDLRKTSAERRANLGIGNLSILLPMISGKSELDDSLLLIKRARDEIEEESGERIDLPEVGAMIEVPSAVYQIEDICQLVDFVSVGTNDLTQYLLAVDRNNENVAELYSSMHRSPRPAYTTGAP